MQRRLEKVEIQDWLQVRKREFSYLESAYVGEDFARFKHRYLFECLHEIF
jgi:hypothetical protein